MHKSSNIYIHIHLCVRIGVGQPICRLELMHAYRHACVSIHLLVCLSVQLFIHLQYIYTYRHRSIISCSFMRKRLRFQGFVHSKPVRIANPKVNRLVCGYSPWFWSATRCMPCIHRILMPTCHMHSCACMCVNNMYLSIDRSI